MTAWLRSAGAAALAGTAVAGAAAGLTRSILRRSLPETSGSIRVPGLHGVVTIDRDAWGIPHLTASNLEDLYFGNGFVHAQDRLWQMELSRRVSAGRLSELFGRLALDADRLMRRMGLRRVAELEVARLPSDIRDLYKAYCRGVNFAVSGLSGRWPIEFGIVRAMPPPRPRWRPEPWTIADSLAYGKLMAFGLGLNWSSELVRAALLAKLGPPRAAALEPVYPAGSPVVLPSAGIPPGLASSLLEAYAELEPFLAASGVGAGGFSNNWVVDGSRTASGKPLLANDPHLGLQMPSIWYEIELNGPGFEVTGAGFPGTPGVVIGHNSRMAWGITSSPIDAQDLVIEQINPNARHEYMFEGKWHEGRIVRETIAVRGRSVPVVEDVLVTRHGPIVSAATDPDKYALALRWTALTPGDLGRAVAGINRAGSWAEFVAALRHWDAPTQNFVYADVDGNIGYYTPGTVPIRSKGDGSLPVPGWTGEYEWTGSVPFHELPHQYNPADHQIVTANHRLTGSDYPHFLGNEWLAGYRAQRITDLLGKRTDLTVDDFRQMQLDVYSIPGREAAALLQQVTGRTETECAVLARARDWDGQLTHDTVGGCICLVFQHHLLRAVFEPILGEITEAYLGTGTSVVRPRNGFFSRSIPFVYELARSRDDTWFERMGVPGNTWDAVLHRALSDTVSFLTIQLGSDVSTWRWGRLNRLSFHHPLGQWPLLDRWLSRGPFELGGDDNTIAAAFLPLHSPFDRNGWSASYRLIVDLGSLDRSLSMHTTGQSGHPASPHYDDMIAAWREGRYHPMSLPAGDVRRELGGHLVLEPAQPAAAPNNGVNSRP